MEILNLFNGNFSGQNMIITFFKLFGLVFSMMFFVFTLIINRQVSIMLKVIQVVDDGPLKRQTVIPLISLILLLVGVLVLGLSVVNLFS
jgi:hypothetical protein